MCEVLIADNHPLFRVGLASLLREEGYSDVAVVGDDDDLIEITRERDPELLIVGENFRNGHGGDILAELWDGGNTRPLILMTEQVNSRRTFSAIKSGVNGVVAKRASVESIRECLRAVRKGERWIDQQHLQSALAIALGTDRTASQFAGLTKREQQIVELISDNLSNAEMASRLGISAGTVKVHLHNIYQKLGLDNRVDLVLMVRDQRDQDFENK